jgi:hypothetical protein
MNRTLPLAALALALALLAGCTEPAGMPGHGAGAPLRTDLPAHVNRDIAALRAATAAFHRIDVAHAAGFDAQFPPGCFESDAGAMGFHFLNEANVGTLSVTRPQLVMYEPQANGSMLLVGVEYIMPGLPTDTPPRLFGRDFAYNAVFEVWVLHVWAWRHNPAGMFADWNPTVSCAHAGAAIDAHH